MLNERGEYVDRLKLDNLLGVMGGAPTPANRQQMVKRREKDMETIKVRGYEGIRVRGYKGTRVRGYKGTKVRGYEGTRV